MTDCVHPRWVIYADNQNVLECVACGTIKARVTRMPPLAEHGSATAWTVCTTCRNVIEPHDCLWGAEVIPRRHGEGTNHGYECPEYNPRHFPDDHPCAYCGRTIRPSQTSRLHTMSRTSVQSQRSTVANATEATNPEWGERSRHMNGITEGNLITNGTTRATVIASTDSFAICVPEEGGDEFVLNASNVTTWRNVFDAPSTLVPQRKFVVYAADGTRVDGYKYESRARRNNDERFAGTGYWLGVVDPSTFTWVSA